MKVDLSYEEIEGGVGDKFFTELDDGEFFVKNEEHTIIGYYTETADSSWMATIAFIQSEDSGYKSCKLFVWKYLGHYEYELKTETYLSDELQWMELVKFADRFDGDLCSACNHPPVSHAGKNGEWCDDCEGGICLERNNK